MPSAPPSTSCSRGVAPFSGTNPLEVCNRHCNEAVVPPSARAPWLDISPEADRIVLRAMAKDPEKRYPSAQAMIADIEAALSRSPTGPLPALEQYFPEDRSDEGPRSPAPGPSHPNESTGARKSRAAEPPARPADLPSLILQSSVEAPTEVEHIASRGETALKLGIPLVSALVFALVSLKLAPAAISTPAQTISAIPAVSSPPASTTPSSVPEQLPPSPGTSPKPQPSPPETSPAPQVPPPATNPPPPEPPALPQLPSPETSFDYASARKVLHDEKRYFHNECMKRFGTRDAELTIHVRKGGVVRSVNVTAERKSAAACLRRLIKTIVFDPSPRGGAFLYKHPSGEIEPLPLVEQSTPRGEP
jgi:serine/threonine protein kinase